MPPVEQATCPHNPARGQVVEPIRRADHGILTPKRQTSSGGC